ncbi:hypothetical protein Acid345_4367 [Candidatus Koribacter versatilis Ellin345]|uniref:Uncharacterized protein n=2 Tax=Candidatus Korobacter versatilis TaxID=658062 RepID=Q1IID3_KORVE|nr:hypothetical protein Acid345_4367 [Candidatus Koribacter versatilis Ellin345]
MTRLGGRLGRLFCWAVLAGVVCAWAVMEARAAGPQVTTIADVVYRADGKPASGWVVISWNAFVTADGAAVAAGTKSVQLGADGIFSVTLAPNAGAIPAGSYYSVTMKLDGGASSKEAWLVPAESPVTVARVRATEVPATMAVQSLTEDWATSNLVSVGGAQTVTGAKSFATSPSVPDPVKATDAASKNYVDANAGGSVYAARTNAANTFTQPQAFSVGITSQTVNGTVMVDQFSTAGDGTTGNCYTGWENALVASNGREFVFSPGKCYSTAGGIVLGGSFVIRGSGSNATSSAFIKCTGSGELFTVNSAVSAGVTQGFAIYDLLLDGNRTCTSGILFGHSSGGPLSANGNIYNVLAQHFKTAGFNLVAAEEINFYGIHGDYNSGSGMVIGDGVSGNINTTIQCFGCRFGFNSLNGVDVEGGVGLHFYGLIAEQNGLEGVKLVGNTTQGVVENDFYGAWLEANNTSRSGGPYYQLYADPTSGSILGLRIINSHFGICGTGNQAIYLGHVGGSAGNGTSYLSGNRYQACGAVYGTVANTSAANLTIYDEASLNWSLGEASAVTFDYLDKTFNKYRVLSGPVAVGGATVGVGDLTVFTTGTGAGLVCESAESANTLQTCPFATRSYDGSHLDTLILSNASAGNTVLNYGGGSGVQYAATQHHFYAAANNTTIMGADVFDITSSQLTAAIPFVSSAGGTFAEIVGTSLALGHCASAAVPAPCGSSAQGFVNIAAAANSVTVNTTAVTATSTITVMFDESVGAALGVTCTTASASEGAAYFVSTRTAGVGFTIETNMGPTTNPACLAYTITN